MATGIGGQMSLERHLFLPQMTVQAMRDSRYRHPANALAELIDNSIDARARRVEVLVRERFEQINQRPRWRIYELAVFDNGHGMSEETLVQALRFGGHAPTRSTKRIGKYGMGLPTSSVSQCRRVDVWTWQTDSANPSHSYIDVDQIGDGSQIEVPEPDGSPIPTEWLDLVSPDTHNPKQGTLVVWSRPDRITVQASTIFRQVEEEIGRIYRHYISDKSLTIRMASIKDGDDKPYDDKWVRPNDPLYLMPNSSTPEPWNQEPMFEPHQRTTIPVTANGREELVEIVYSIAKKPALGQYRNLPGNRDYGRHARKNMGVSIVRENREILLEHFFITESGGGSLPQNRWWGCEVRFNSGCDDKFGVDHNKQMAAHLARAIMDLSANEDNPTELTMDDLGVEQDDIYKIAAHIRNTVKGMMDQIHTMFSQRPPPEPADGEQPATSATTAEINATNATRALIENDPSQLTETDRIRNTMGNEERTAELTDYLVTKGFDEPEAKRQAEIAIRNDIWYKFVPAQLRANQVFSVASIGGVTTVNLNIHHSIYDLLRMIEEETDQHENEEVRRAAIAIQAMLLAWSRMEVSIENPQRKIDFQETTDKWGQMVNYILR